ncbi:DUF72 domain-containing protein [Pseudomonas sp. 2835]|uniref:DUF72 domain-containing protein n=1 Tax=Pseudomonas sp. 2835 TaxID=3156451 RepID=UPI003D219C09
MSLSPLLHLGCAGWSLPRQHWPAFATQGTHLQRYAWQLQASEINSSFYRPHQTQTYARWAQSVPKGFRFSVKLPKQITHVQRLVDCQALLDSFLGQCHGLGPQLGCLLVQLPPSLAYEADSAERFFQQLRSRFDGALVLEPRHASWLQAQALLEHLQIARVAADPSPLHAGDQPGGWQGLRYWRLHGSPRIYFSAYGPQRLAVLAVELQRSVNAGVPTWCIFDNTASGAAVADALLLQQLLT